MKNIMTGEVMRILDGPFGIADVTIENLLCGTNNGVIEENIRRIQAITPARYNGWPSNTSAAKILSRPSWERSIQSMRFNGKRLSSIKRIRPDFRPYAFYQNYIPFASTHRVSSTKSATESCSARCVKKGCSAPPKSPESRPQGSCATSCGAGRTRL